MPAGSEPGGGTGPRHLVERCSAPGCGLRYPIPVNDPRRGACPACDAASQVVATYQLPPAHRPAGPATSELAAVFDSVRSALNVGTMLRAVDGAGWSEAHLCGLTANTDNPKVIKTALGAERQVTTRWWPDVVACVTTLASEGWTVWALEATATSTRLDAGELIPNRVALVVGNETAGVDPEVLDLAERHVHLPMAGVKSTLNVGVAFGIAAYALRGLAAG